MCRRAPGESAKQQGAGAPAGRGALSRVLTRLTSALVDQPARRVAQDSLLFAPRGVLFEVWFQLQRRRRNSRAAFLQKGAEVAVTLGAPETGLESGAFASLGRGRWGKGIYALMGSLQLLSRSYGCRTVPWGAPFMSFRARGRRTHRPGSDCRLGRKTAD